MLAVELNDLMTEAQGWIVIVLLVVIFLTLVGILTQLVRLLNRKPPRTGVTQTYNPGAHETG